MPIDDLIGGELSRQMPLSRRYSFEQLSQVERDLQRILDAARAGLSTPAVASLKQFFADEYGMELSETTIKNALRKMKTGKPVWPKT